MLQKSTCALVMYILSVIAENTKKIKGVDWARFQSGGF